MMKVEAEVMKEMKKKGMVSDLLDEMRLFGECLASHLKWEK